MIPRSYWARAGAALVVISIASAIAEVIALTTTDRSHAPLWPLGLCAIVFMIGAALFWFRRDEESASIDLDAGRAAADTATAPVPRYPGREFADATPSQMLKTFEDNTAIQAAKLVSRHYGKWLRATGPINDVGEWMSCGSALTLENHQVMSDSYMTFWFTNRSVAKRTLAVLQRGVSLTVIGKIDSIDSLHISLTDCEIESIHTGKEKQSPL